MDEATPQRSELSRPPAVPRWLGRTLLVLLTLALLWSAAWFAVPALVGDQIEKTGRARLGRAVHVGRVAFNPWTLELTIDDLVVAGAKAADPPQLAVKRLYADAAATSLLRLAPIVDHLRIESPQLRVVRRADGSYDVDDVLSTLAATAAPAKPDDEPARFALHNIVVSDGSADFVDEPVGATRRLRALELALPFLSSLAAERQIDVEPRLSFSLDGNRFDSAAAATPFSASGHGQASLKLADVDLVPYFAYLPRGLPVLPRSARLSADLRLEFEQRPRLSLIISGSVEARDIAVVDARSNELMQAGSIKVAIDDLRPLERIVRLRQVDVDAPHVFVVRDGAGRLNLQVAVETPGQAPAVIAGLPLPMPAASAASSASEASRASAVAATTATRSPAPRGWQASLQSLSVKAGVLDWRDATTAPAAALALRDFTLAARSIAWPLDAPIAFEGGGTLATVGAAKLPATETSSTPVRAATKATTPPTTTPAKARPKTKARPPTPASAPVVPAASGTLHFSGTATAQRAQTSLTVTSLPLVLAKPYVAGLIAPPLTGSLSADLAIDWQQDPAGAARLSVVARKVAVDALRLGDAKSPEVVVDQVVLADATVDVSGRSATLGSLAVHAPRLRVVRAADGVLAMSRWAQPAASASAPPAAGDAASSAASSIVTLAPAAPSPSPSPSTPTQSTDRLAPWRVAVGDLTIDKGALAWVDQRAGIDAAIDVSAIDLRLQHAGLDSAEPAPFRLAARVSVPSRGRATSAGAGIVGRVAVQGELAEFAAGVPARARAKVELTDLPLQLVDPYLADLLNVVVQKAQTSFRGQLDYRMAAAGPSLRLAGEASVDDFRASSASLDGSEPRRALAMVADRPGAGRQLLSWKSLSMHGVDVAIAPGKALRVDVGETVLSDFFARLVLDPTGRLNLQDLVKTAAPASAPGSAGAPDAAASSAVAVATATASPAAAVRIGPIAFVNGRVAFNDRFIKPNYSADLTELSGRLGAFSSTPPAAGAAPELAALELKGRAEGTAALDISGRINPLVKPLALDIQAKVRDLELPPLSPYAIKYAGYGIQRGKMSVDVAYVVEPDGQLKATNKIVLNQLTFGDKVEGAPASLPVKMAVALLADRHGVIDLDLPVSGSIN
ncbi:MAG: DUF748 domain-containing protein, partial [Caldimonas sp.]